MLEIIPFSAECLIDILRILIHSKYNNKKNFSIVSTNNILRILGNGKSLSNFEIEKESNIDYLVVNRHVLADNYKIIKPSYYVLADPHFFSHKEGMSILERINNDTTWEMTLFVPYGSKTISRMNEIMTNKNICVIGYNSQKYNQLAPLSSYFYKHQLAMPCVQNVLVAAIMIGIMKQYQRIELYGVEHNWLNNLYVGDDNLVYLSNPHFYDKGNVKPKPQKDIQYLEEYPLHKNIKDYARMFESYWEIKKYLDQINSSIKITNRTKGSFIDAFERG